MPPVPMNRIPARRQTASVPPTVVAPSVRWAAQAPRSLGPAFRASCPAAPKRASSSSLSPTTTDPSRTPIVAGRAPAARTADSAASPTSTPTLGGKPCAISVVSSATTGPPLWSASCTSGAIRSNSVTVYAQLCAGSRGADSRDIQGETGRVACSHGHRPHLRHAARGRLQAELDPAHLEPGRECVARARRVDNFGPERRVLLGAVRSDHRDPARPALDDRRLREPVRPAHELPLGLVRKDQIGGELLQPR